jgi:hypothetical protein
MGLPQRVFGQRISKAYKLSKRWLFKLRERVIVCDKPFNSCLPTELNIEAAKLVSNSLRDA